MKIDSYQFGKVVIDGVTYTSDCMIVEGVVQPNWWRRQGHLLCAEDLQQIVQAKPEVLVVGCGASGVMEVSEQAKRLLEEKGIVLEALRTDKACERFNELSRTGVNVAAALHLTC